MKKRKKTAVTMMLDLETIDCINQVSKLAHVDFDDVVNVWLATEILKHSKVADKRRKSGG